VVNRDGSVIPDVSELSMFQYGLSAHPELRNPPTFVVDFTTNGEFIMFISQGSPSGARAQVRLDGIIAADQTIPSGTTNITVTVKIPAGKHNISVDSVDSDWYMTESFTFTNVFSALQTYSLIGKSKTLGWTRSKAHTWWLIKNNATQPQISDGTFVLDICSSPSIWKLEWWNTVKGEIATTTQVQCSCTNGKCSPLTISVPEIDSKNVYDWGFKLFQ